MKKLLVLLNIEVVMASSIDYNNMCSNSGVGSAMVIVGYIILVAKWIVPLIIIVTGMIDFGKASISSDDKALNKAASTLIRRFVAGVVIFFVPTIIGAFTKNILKTNITNEFVKCTNCMFSPVECSEEVKLLKEQERKAAEEEREKLEQERLEQAKKEEEERQQQQQSSVSNKPTSSSNPTVKYIDLTSLGCTVYYDIYKNQTKSKLAFDEAVADDMQIVFKNICNYVNRTPHMSYLQTAGAYVNRAGGAHDYHAKGRAVDLNNQWSITVNGKKYNPYYYQGSNVWAEYKRFICDVCDGKEDCEYNVNYQIFHKYFKPYGWCWGGNWSPEWFDPMHYELRDGGCSVSTRSITC